MMRFFASLWHPCYLYDADRIVAHSSRLSFDFQHQRK